MTVDVIARDLSPLALPVAPIVEKNENMLEGRSIKKVSAPGFGENRSRTKPDSWLDILKKVAAVALTVILGACIGFLVGGPIGAAIGAASGVALVGAVVVAKVVIDILGQKRFLRQLPDQGSHKALLPDNAPKVGKYYEANVRLTEKADCGFEWKKALIESAQESIELSVNFAGGSSYREVLELMDTKMTQNEQIKTHMIASVDLLEPADKEMLNKMKEKFGDRFNVLITDRYYKVGLDFHSEENHVKMLVVDGKYFVGGGTGIHPRLSREHYDLEQDGEKPTPAARLLDPASKDADIVGESKEIAHAMRDQFFNLYRLWEIRTTNSDHASRYFPLTREPGYCQKFAEGEGVIQHVRMKFLVGGPEHRGNNPIVKEYAKRISKAKSEIRIANWVLNPSKKIRRALKNAAALNPDLKRVAHLNGIGSNFSIGRLSQTHSGRGNYHLVDKIYEYRGHHQVYHKKVATFDDSHMIIGSFNLGKKSAKYDHEVAFVIKNKEVTELGRARLKKDKTHSKKIDQDSSIGKSAISRVVSFVFAQATQNFL